MSAVLSNEEIITAYFETGSMTEAARTLGIGRTSLYKYLQNTELKEQIATMRKERFTDTVEKLNASLDNAIESLQRLVSSSNESV